MESDKGEEWITFEIQNDKLVQVEQKGFYGLSQQDILMKVNSNISDFEIDFGCGECEEIVNPTYGELENELEIFNKLTQLI